MFSNKILSIFFSRNLEGDFMSGKNLIASSMQGFLVLLWAFFVVSCGDSPTEESRIIEKDNSKLKIVDFVTEIGVCNEENAGKMCYVRTDGELDVCVDGEWLAFKTGDDILKNMSGGLNDGLVVLEGKDGTNGQNGKDGVDGKDGKDGGYVAIMEIIDSIGSDYVDYITIRIFDYDQLLWSNSVKYTISYGDDSKVDTMTAFVKGDVYESHFCVSYAESNESCEYSSRDSVIVSYAESNPSRVITKKVPVYNEEDMKLQKESVNMPYVKFDKKTYYPNDVVRILLHDLNIGVKSASVRFWAGATECYFPLLLHNDEGYYDDFYVKVGNEDASGCYGTYIYLDDTRNMVVEYQWVEYEDEESIMHVERDTALWIVSKLGNVRFGEEAYDNLDSGSLYVYDDIMDSSVMVSVFNDDGDSINVKLDWNGRYFYGKFGMSLRNQSMNVLNVRGSDSIRAVYRDRSEDLYAVEDYAMLDFEQEMPQLSFTKENYCVYGEKAVIILQDNMISEYDKVVIDVASKNDKLELELYPQEGNPGNRIGLFNMNKKSDKGVLCVLPSDVIIATYKYIDGDDTLFVKSTAYFELGE